MRYKKIDSFHSRTKSNHLIDERRLNSPAQLHKKRLQEDNNDWLVTYSDIVTLLLAFFVLMLSASEISQSKFEQVRQSINQELLEKENTVSPLLDLQENISTVFEVHGINPIDSILLGDNFLKIELPSETLFESASDKLNLPAIQLLADIANRINKFELNRFQVEIEGHSDDMPIQTTRFPSNWELSSSRAISVLKVFIESGVENSKLKAVGYADTRPSVPNRDIDGNAITENQKINRRVEIKIIKDFSSFH